MMRLLGALLVLVAATTASAETRSVTRNDGLELARHIVVDDSSLVAARAQSRIIYLNKNGVTLTPGATDSRINRSAMAPAQVAIPPWNASATLWSQTVSCVREMFAPFDVQITETDPGNVPHVEAVFGGSPALLGMSSKTAGVSPFSTSCKVIENSMVFTFTEVLPQDAKVACEVMAQEIAHSYGLDHELLAADPMTYLPYAGKRAFQDMIAECGESTARPCGVQGYAACRVGQNSYALLLERLGAAGTVDESEPATPPAPTPSEDEGTGDTDEHADDGGMAEMVGCSAGGSGAGALMILLVLMAVYRLRDAARDRLVPRRVRRR